MASRRFIPTTAAGSGRRMPQINEVRRANNDAKRMTSHAATAAAAGDHAGAALFHRTAATFRGRMMKAAGTTLTHTGRRASNKPTTAAHPGNAAFRAGNAAHARAEAYRQAGATPPAQGQRPPMLRSEQEKVSRAADVQGRKAHRTGGSAEHMAAAAMHRRAASVQTGVAARQLHEEAAARHERLAQTHAAQSQHGNVSTHTTNAHGSAAPASPSVPVAKTPSARVGHETARQAVAAGRAFEGQRLHTERARAAESRGDTAEAAHHNGLATQAGTRLGQLTAGRLGELMGERTPGGRAAWVAQKAGQAFEHHRLTGEQLPDHHILASEMRKGGIKAVVGDYTGRRAGRGGRTTAAGAAAPEAQSPAVATSDRYSVTAAAATLQTQHAVDTRAAHVDAAHAHRDAAAAARSAGRNTAAEYHDARADEHDAGVRKLGGPTLAHFSTGAARPAATSAHGPDYAAAAAAAHAQHGNAAAHHTNAAGTAAPASPVVARAPGFRAGLPTDRTAAMRKAHSTLASSKQVVASGRGNVAEHATRAGHAAVAVGLGKLGAHPAAALRVTGRRAAAPRTGAHAGGSGGKTAHDPHNGRFIPGKVS